MGYSDITILLHAIGIFAHQIVFYGPTLMTEMAEYPVPPQLSQTSFMDVFSDASTYEVTPCDALLEKGSDWALPPKERKALCPVKQRVIRSGKASGVVLGGCIEALERLRGTRYWPCFKDSLLILETVDDEFDEKKWRSLIVDYTNMGIFEEVAGIIIGQKTWNDDEVDKLSEMFLKVTTENAVPILYGLPFGHISPIATIPLFAKATLDSDLMKLIYNKPFEYGYVLR